MILISSNVVVESNERPPVIRKLIPESDLLHNSTPDFVLFLNPFYIIYIKKHVKRVNYLK